MKTINFNKTIILTFSLYLFSSFCYAQWQPQNSGTNNHLTSVCFVDNNNGWAVGGETWNEQTSGTDFLLESIHFTDAENGWIAGWAGGNTPQTGGIILRTSNGGTNWEEVFTDSLYRVKDVFFSDQDNGWAIGLGLSFWFYWNTILHTNDGGETWNIQDTLLYGNLKSIHFIDANTGWIVGGGYHISSNTPYHHILHTNNGGINWEEKANSIHVAPLNSVCFIDSENGWAVGTNRDMFPRPNIFHTFNGGNQWDSLLYVGSNGSTYSLESVCFTDLNNGWAVGGRDWWVSQEFNIILYTGNGGDSWEEQFSGTTFMLNSVCFTDPENGWIVGGSGVILHTDNGGITAIEESQTLNSKLQILYYPNPFSDKLITTIILPESAYTIIEIYSSAGIGIKEFYSGLLSEGKHEFHWKTDDLLPGTYFIQLQTGNDFITKKVIKL